MSRTQHNFGGSWTADKLGRLKKYLVAYTTIMSKQRFRYAYIDAFAGTGYIPSRRSRNQLSLPEGFDQESREFLDGSARIALQIEPRFTRYIFVERAEKRFAELARLREEFPSHAQDIELVNADANGYIKDLCRNRKWARHRAVLFLDPFGMQVEWDTLAAIAQTKAIDLWLLFPLGIGVNRLLKRDGDISPEWCARLDALFGTQDWYEAFYGTSTMMGLFGEESRTEKVATFDAIERYFVNRLKTVFAGVANNPLVLYNSRGNPLYLLCFAAGNPKGAATAIKIAQDILRR